MKVPAKAAITETLRLMTQERDALRLVGAQMANLCFNLSQSKQVSASNAEVMARLCKEWDGIKRVVRI